MVVRPHADDLYLGVAVALVVAGAVVATMCLRRFVRRPGVVGVVVGAMVLLLLALAPRPTPDVVTPDVVGATDRRPGPVLPAPTRGPAPTVMRRVPVPTTTTMPPARQAARVRRGSGDPPPPASTQPPAPAPAPVPAQPPPTTTAPVVVLPTVPTTVTVTTAPGD